MRILLLLVHLVLLATLAPAARAGKGPERGSRSTQKPNKNDASDQSPESQDPSDYNLHVTTALGRQGDHADSDYDELDSDNDNRPAPNTRIGTNDQTRRRVQFDVPRTPVQSEGEDKNAAAVPNTPNSLGWYLFGHQRSASDSDLYARPAQPKRQGADQDDQLDRKWHPWYIFNNQERRKRFAEVKKQFMSATYDISSSTGATMVSFLGRPEKDPAHPDRLGELIVSRDIRRNEELYKAAQQLFEQFRKLIAMPRRKEYEAEYRRAIEMRDALKGPTVVAKKPAVAQARAPAARQQQAQKKRKRKPANAKGTASDAEQDESTVGTGEEDAPDLDATPKRPPPRLRNRNVGGVRQRPVVDADTDHEESEIEAPGPQRLFDEMTSMFGPEDMAVDDDDFLGQLGEAAVRSRREKEQEELRQAKPGESSGSRSGAVAQRQPDNNDVEEVEGQASNSSRSRISRGRGPEPDASDTSRSTRASLRAGPSNSASGSGAPSGSAGRPGTVRSVNGVYVGPSGLVPVVEVPRLHLRQPPPLPAAGRGSGLSDGQGIHDSTRRTRLDAFALDSGRNGSGPDPDTISVASAHTQPAALHADAGDTHAHYSPADHETLRPIGVSVAALALSRPASARAPASAAPICPAPQPASIQPAPPDRAPPVPPDRAPPVPMPVRGSFQLQSMHADSPPASVPPTLDAAELSDSDSQVHGATASELPPTVQQWLRMHQVADDVWVDVEMAYLTGIDARPVERRAIWMAELEGLQAELMVTTAQMKELMLLMLRAAVAASK